MRILSHRTVWKRKPTPAQVRAVLADSEIGNVKAALEVVRLRLGTWVLVGAALGLPRGWFHRHRKKPGLTLAFRVSRFVGVPLEGQKNLTRLTTKA